MPEARAAVRSEPNPLLERELRQSLRLPRLPWVIAASVAVVGLSILSFGSLDQGSSRSAKLGAGLYQTLTWLIVLYAAVLGPSTAAGSISSEREGKTLEPLLLTELTPSDITRGKFLAAYGTLGLQIVALLPLAAIPMLFGGVSASELVVTWIYLAAIAANAVGFGLVVASRARSNRNAIVISSVLPACGSFFFFAAATAAGEVARERWPFLASGPLWWTGAYATVPFDLDYVLFLILWPLALLGLPLWIFLTSTSANLRSANDDRGSGAKLWMLVAALTFASLTFLTCFRVPTHVAKGVGLAAILVASLAAFLLVPMLVSEPLTASRRVRARWDAERRGPFGRFLGAGLVSGAIVHVVSLAIVLAAAIAGSSLGSVTTGLRARIGVASPMGSEPGVAGAFLVLVVAVALFFLFVVGLACFNRARAPGEAGVVRAAAWTVALTIIAVVLPGVAAAIVAAIGGHDGNAWEIAASPSPAFAIYAFGQELMSGNDAGRTTTIAFAAAFAWGVTGITLLGLAWDRARRSIASLARAAAKTDETLRLEDEEGDDDE
jgi:ABC-type transport system involved in multi-copper enzyme maturation permease subunit